VQWAAALLGLASIAAQWRRDGHAAAGA